MIRVKPTSCLAFTIVELMVVVSLIALLIGASVPLIFKIDELSRDRTGVNSFSVGVSAARAYATRRIADSLSHAKAEYSGVALLVTPMNQLRLIEDVQDDALEAKDLSGYNDIPRFDPIAMPRGVGVVGIGRDAAGTIVLLPAPFVIRFNKFGQLVTEVSALAAADPAVNPVPSLVDRNLVIYPSTAGNGTARNRATYTPTSTTLASNYDPDFASIQAQFNASTNLHNLPFSKLEAVIGVITYSKADFEDAGGAFPASTPSLGCLDGSCGSIREWMLDNGNILFFSRNTGNIMRINRP